MRASCSERLYANTVWHRGRAAATRLRREVFFTSFRLRTARADYITRLYDDDGRYSNGTAAVEKRIGKKKNSVFHARYAKHRANDDDAKPTATDANNALPPPPPPYVRCGWHGGRRNRRAAAAAVEQTVGNGGGGGGERFVGGGFGGARRDGAGCARTRRARGMRLWRCEERKGARLPSEGNGGGGTAATSGGPISRHFSSISFSVTFLNQPNFHRKRQRQLDGMAVLQDCFFDESLEAAATTLGFQRFFVWKDTPHPPKYRQINGQLPYS